MKKLIFSLGLLGLIAAGCNASQNNQNQNQQPPTNQQTQTPPTPTTKTYTDAKNKFEFTYPSTFNVVDATYSNLKNQLVQVSLGKDAYPNTNFGDAAFTVGSASARTLNDCLKMNAPENGKNFKQNSTINGVPFYSTTGTGAAAGNLYDSRIYRVYKNNLCYELTETIHTGNIGNYPTGTVTEVNKQSIWDQLNSILTSFQFTK